MATIVRPEHWLICRSAQEWHDWLAANHNQATEVWLYIRKAAVKSGAKSSAKSGVTLSESEYDAAPGILLGDAVTEAIRFGWIDSRMYSLDASGFILRFTPRNPNSIWSLGNRTLAESLIADGRMMPAGLAAVRAGQASGKWQAAYTAREEPAVPDYLAAALQVEPALWDVFSRWAPSMKLQYIFWIEEAKRPDTRQRRIDALIAAIRSHRQ